MPSLSIFDYAFLLTETSDSPKHVAGLQIFEPPADYEGNFVSDLVEAMSTRRPGKPFNLKLRGSLKGAPAWVEDRQFDLSYHLRQARLPKPGTVQQLMDHVGRLHAIVLDRQRPLWEVHVIEGLEGGRFAVYFKIHHAYCDGATLVKILIKSLNTSPDDRRIRATWEANEAAAYRESTKTLAARLGSGLSLVRTGVTASLELARLGARMTLRGLGFNATGLPVPFTAPRTQLNTQVHRARRAAIGEIDLDELKALAGSTGTTLNDVIVTLCDMALTRYLRERGDVPEKPLVAQMPINVRRQGENAMGNQIAILPVHLGHAGRDPLKRLREISSSCAGVKAEATALSPVTVSLYTLFIQGLSEVGGLLGVADRMPPLGNVLISNVPGPTTPLYLWGARMVRSYPMSVIPAGLAMNITVFSYAGKLDIGFVAGYDAIPDVELLPDYMHDAFKALKAAAERQATRSHRPNTVGRAAGGGRRRAAKATARKKAAAKTGKKRASRKSGNGAASRGTKSRAAGKAGNRSAAGRRAKAVPAEPTGETG